MMSRTLPFLFLLFAFTYGPAHAQKGSIAFEETHHSFGSIEEGVEARHVFTFRNEGDAPLRLVRVLPSCGCTTPEWTREPVAPGETGTVTAIYHSQGRPGPFEKSISVVTDGDPRMVTLHIEGDVQPPRLDGGTAQGSLLIEEEVVDLGAVSPDRDVWHAFRLQNTGSRPVRILEASAPASNVAVEFPGSPLSSGDVAEVKVLINTSVLEEGSFDYPISLQTDDTAQPVKSLRIHGTLN